METNSDVNLVPNIGAVSPGAFTLGSKVVTHSISSLDNEIITWEVAIPKWMIGEFNTHKVEIERNSASSRAVPSGVIIDIVKVFPCLPFEWRYNASGMASQELMSKEDAEYANNIWLESRDLMIEQVQKLQNLPSGRKADKQRANRLLEFCMGTIVVCTMTSGGRIGMNNFFGLRDNSGAQPEFKYVANMMHEQWHTSKPDHVQWHLPYISKEQINPYADNFSFENLAITSSAMCGRVTHYKQGEINPKTNKPYTNEENIERGLSFLNNGHFSPLRHASREGGNEWYGNMYGWEPISKIITGGKDYVQQCCERENKR